MFNIRGPYPVYMGSVTSAGIEGNAIQVGASDGPGNAVIRSAVKFSKWSLPKCQTISAACDVESNHAALI